MINHHNCIISTNNCKVIKKCRGAWRKASLIKWLLINYHILLPNWVYCIAVSASLAGNIFSLFGLRSHLNHWSAPGPLPTIIIATQSLLNGNYEHCKDEQRINKSQHLSPSHLLLFLCSSFLFVCFLLAPSSISLSCIPWRFARTTRRLTPNLFCNSLVWCAIHWWIVILIFLYHRTRCRFRRP